MQPVFSQNTASTTHRMLYQVATRERLKSVPHLKFKKRSLEKYVKKAVFLKFLNNLMLKNTNVFGLTRAFLNSQKPKGKPFDEMIFLKDQWRQKLEQNLVF